MGSPTWTGKSRFTAGEQVWSYHRKVETEEHGYEHTSLFRFRTGKLSCVELRRDLLGEG